MTDLPSINSCETITDALNDPKRDTDSKTTPTHFTLSAYWLSIIADRLSPQAYETITDALNEPEHETDYFHNPFNCGFCGPMPFYDSNPTANIQHLSDGIQLQSVNGK